MRIAVQSVGTIGPRAGQQTAQGIKEDNQDCLGLRVPVEPALSTKGIAAVIADGMSACMAGREASEASVKGFLLDYYSTPDSWTVKTSAQKILTALNQWLFSKGHAAGYERYGLVTTLSILVLKSNTAHLFHVGDTRIYRIRETQMELLTRDHRVWTSPEKNYLNRAMGVDVRLDIDYKTEVVEVGDIFVLTTDGIHDYLDDGSIKAVILAAQTDFDGAADTLIQQALANDSQDNLSAQVIQVTALPLQDAGEAYQQLMALPIPPDLEAGNVIDGYKILRELHASSRSQLYLALDTETDDLVALKTPSINFEDDEVYLEAFLHEDWVGQRINDPHVLKIPPQLRKRRFMYTVSEFIEGQTLRQWMNDHPEPELTQVRMIVEQLCVGLRAFHRLEMLHQDLKPENVMIDQYGVIKLIDFGSVKIAGLAEVHSPLERHHLMGTLDYCAPEYFKNQPGTTRSDLYSVAIIAYEMLTGKLPYVKSGLSRKINREYVSIRTYAASVPVWVDGAFKKALQLDPQKRYEVLSEFLYDLSHPNEAFMQQEFVPLLDRNPASFWRGLSILLLLCNLFLLYLLST